MQYEAIYIIYVHPKFYLQRQYFVYNENPDISPQKFYEQLPEWKKNDFIVRCCYVIHLLNSKVRVT